MSSWDDKLTVRKGALGESLVRKFLEEAGYIVYEPKTEGAHAFDKLCVSRDKKVLFIVEVKTKPHRLKYPDTGIDIRHYQEYLHIQEKYGVDVLIFFVDEFKKQIYANKLKELDRERTVWHDGRRLDYPLEQGGIRYYPLEAMKKVCDLNAGQAAQIEGLSSRSYNYPD